LRSMTPTALQPRSRRAILAGALGGIGALAASAIGRTTSVLAATNDPVLVDNAHTGAGTTQITSTGSQAFRVIKSNAPGRAIHGEATSTDPGGWGVVGETQSTAGTGVLGFASNNVGTSWGVYGESFSPSGVGVVAWNGTGGLAFRSQGRAKFSTSGVASIPAGSTSKTINPGVNVTSKSFVLLTPKTNIGTRALWFSTNPSTDRFTIRMNSARSSSTRVAWLLLG
jgi:hypothetical protein